MATFDDSLLLWNSMLDATGDPAVRANLMALKAIFEVLEQVRDELRELNTTTHRIVRRP